MTRPHKRGPGRVAKPRPVAALAIDGGVAPGGRTPMLAHATLGALLAGYALTTIAIIARAHPVGDYFTETDFYGAYALGAAALQHGHLDPARYGVIGPVYEIVLALVGFAIRNLFLAAETISLLAMLATAWLWARLLERRVDVRLALATTALLLVDPTFLRYGFSATTDALALALQTATLSLLLTTRTRRGALVAGMLAALAFLTRYNAVVLLPAGLLVIGLGGTSLPRRREGLIAFAAGFTLLTLPWLAFSLSHGGQFASQLHHNIAFDVFARPKGMVWDDYQRTMQPQFHSLWDVIRRDPGAVLTRELFNVFDHLRLDARVLLGWPTALCAAIGVVLLVQDDGLRKVWPMLLCAAFAFLALVPAFHSARYSLAMLPCYAMLAGAAFASPRFAFVAGGRVWLKAFVIALPLVLALSVTRTETARVLDQLPVEALEAGRALRALAAPGDRVLVRKPHVAWLGGVEAAPLPLTDSLGVLARVAHDQHARWLFFSWPEAELRPEFSYLLDTTAAVPGLAVRWASRGRPAVLYEIGPRLGETPVWMGNDTLRAYHRSRARLTIDPSDRGALRTVAFVDARDGRDAEARTLFERALALDPTDLASWLLLGDLDLRLDDPGHALDAFERAGQLAPGDPRAQAGLGWALLLSHRPDEAARVWKPLVSVTSDPATLRRMVDLFEQQGDPTTATDARARLVRGVR